MSNFAKVSHLIAAFDDAGQRIDNFLVKKLKGVPKAHIYKIIRTGQVRVNKKRIKPVYKLKPEDQIRLPPIRLTKSKSKNPGQNLLGLVKGTIIFEDKYLLAVNKPAGLAVHGGSGVNYGLIEALRKLYPEYIKLELVHRLDKDTSGCILVSKKRSFLHQAHEALRENKIHKTYLALLAGAIGNDEIKCNLKLRKNILKSGERMVTVDESGKEALSIFKVCKRFDNATLTEIALITGRTHQIRVHAQGIGHPIIGDYKYGDPKINRQFKKTGLKRMFLHASKVKFPHPEKGELTICSPLDSNLTDTLNHTCKITA